MPIKMMNFNFKIKIVRAYADFVFKKIRVFVLEKY